MDIKFSDLTYTVKDALFNKSELILKKSSFSFDLESDRKFHCQEKIMLDSVTEKPVFIFFISCS